MAKNKKASKDVPKELNNQERKGIPVHGLWGIIFLIVCASIVYANYRVFFGVEEMIPRLMLIPSSLAVVMFLVYKSTK